LVLTNPLFLLCISKWSLSFQDTTGRQKYAKLPHNERNYA
jgi:hypothetical protein